MKNDGLKEFLKIDFPDYKVNNEKIISVCKNQKRVNKSIVFEVVLSLSSIVMVILTTLLFNYYGINEKNLGIINNEINLTRDGANITTDFFVIDELQIGKSDELIRIGYKSEYSIFNSNESLEIEVLVGYFGDILSTGLFPDDSNLPKIVLRINENPIVERELVEIENFIENYKLEYIRNENNLICGCKYVFPNESKGIKVNIDSDYFSGVFGELRIGLYVGYVYEAETIYYCKNEKNDKICISNLCLKDAMEKADYKYISGQSTE